MFEDSNWPTHWCKIDVTLTKVNWEVAGEVIVLAAALGMVEG